MKELTLQNFREIVSLYEEVNDISDWSDKTLLDAKLGDDVGLDSLDIIDIIADFEVEYDVIIDSDAFDRKIYPSASDANVKTFLKICNECLR